MRGLLSLVAAGLIGIGFLLNWFGSPRQYGSNAEAAAAEHVGWIASDVGPGLIFLGLMLLALQLDRWLRGISLRRPEPEESVEDDAESPVDCGA